MANFMKLNDEQIKIDVENHTQTRDTSSNNNSIIIILRNPKKEDFQFNIDLKTIKTIKDLRKSVKIILILIFYKISQELLLQKEHLLKMFFKGRPIKDESNLAEFSKINKNNIFYKRIYK